jgi:hypothetical protein
MDELIFINWLMEVADDSVFQSAVSHIVVGVGRNEDRWNRTARIDQGTIKIVAVHPRHMDVGDQAGGFAETRRSEEIGCRRKDFNGVAERSEESSHRFAEGPIIVNDQDQ